MENKLKQEISKEQPADNVEVYDVTLKVSTDNGATWEEVTKENFPKEGLEVAFDLPAGIKAEEVDQYDFLIAHLKEDGTTELLKPTLKEDKLVVVVSGLSPFAVSWKTKEQPIPTTKPTATPAPTNKPTNAPASTNKPNAAGTNRATPAPAKAATIPQTADSFPRVPVAAAALLGLSGLIVLLFRKKERK